MSAFWDALAVAGCRHGRWLDDGPDEMGARFCAICEERVTVVLTERLLKSQMNALARHEGFREPFPGT